MGVEISKNNTYAPKRIPVPGLLLNADFSSTFITLNLDYLVFFAKLEGNSTQGLSKKSVAWTSNF